MTRANVWLAVASLWLAGAVSARAQEVMNQIDLRSPDEAVCVTANGNLGRFDQNGECHECGDGYGCCDLNGLLHCQTPPMCADFGRGLECAACLCANSTVCFSNPRLMSAGSLPGATNGGSASCF